MQRVSCIIFDLDGTLTQTNELIYATFNHVAEKYLNKTFTPKEITGLFGPPEEIAIERLLGKEKSREAMDDFYAFYEHHHPSMASAYGGVREMLEFLKQRGMILAIFTGKGRKTALITLEQIGIRKYFDLIVTGTDVKSHKPSPEGIASVMNRFGLEASQVLMVGDSVSDIRAAHDAGVLIASVVWDSYGKEKVMQMDVDYRFYSVSEFVSWLKKNVSGTAASSQAKG
ncbi:MAG TPA: HAD family hydrolase [Bacteroidota bacterium]|nr:HAD family hydrolase [Bacteroidota bacterium]